MGTHAYEHFPGGLLLQQFCLASAQQVEFKMSLSQEFAIILEPYCLFSFDGKVETKHL